MKTAPSRWLFSRLMLLAALGGSGQAVSAETLTISAGSITEALQTAADPAAGLDALLRQRIERRLDDAGLEFSQGELISTTRLQNVPLREGCTSRASLRELQLEVRVLDGTELQFSLTRLDQPITLALQLKLALQGEGDVDQDLGARIFGRCRYYAEDDFKLQVRGIIQLSLQLELTLQAETLVGVGLRLTPQLTVRGGNAEADVSVGVSDTLLASLLESRIEEAVDAQFSAANQQRLLTQLQSDLQQALSQSLQGDSLTLALENTDADVVQSVYRRIVAEVGFPVSFDYFQKNQSDILLAWLTGEEGVNQLLVAAACDAADLLQVDMPYAPLFAPDSAGLCASADLRALQDTDYFLDPACQQPVAFKPTGIQQYCAETLDKTRFGDATGVLAEPPYWTLNPATRLQIGLLPLDGLAQPFMRREAWREIVNERGVCQLEMRIYKPAIDATDLKPLLLLHGGSWRYRSAGYPAQEAMVAHYTDAGFAVFAPFYRLADEVESTPACHLASGEQIIEDALAALNWVQTNASRFGALSDKINVSGQSAGAYLAASLAVQQPQQVERALLLYPPTDFADFVQQFADGELLPDTSGRSAVEALVGRDLEQMSAVDADILALSLPQQAQNQVGALPPMFLLHGVADTVVPARQSVRLCNALAGSADTGVASQAAAATEREDLRLTFSCDDSSSQLHLLRDAEHALDACFLGVECPAGGPESQRLSRDSLQQAIRWLAQDGAAAMAQENGMGEDALADAAAVSAGAVAPLSPGASASASGGGGGGLGLPFLVLLLLTGWRRR